MVFGLYPSIIVLAYRRKLRKLNPGIKIVYCFHFSLYSLFLVIQIRDNIIHSTFWCIELIYFHISSQWDIKLFEIFLQKICSSLTEESLNKFWFELAFITNCFRDFSSTQKASEHISLSIVASSHRGKGRGGREGNILGSFKKNLI